MVSMLTPAVTASNPQAAAWKPSSVVEERMSEAVGGWALAGSTVKYTTPEGGRGGGQRERMSLWTGGHERRMSFWRGVNGGRLSLIV
jgi:hypothetical protein